MVSWGGWRGRLRPSEDGGRLGEMAEVLVLDSPFRIEAAWVRALAERHGCALAARGVRIAWTRVLKVPFKTHNN